MFYLILIATVGVLLLLSIYKGYKHENMSYLYHFKTKGYKLIVILLAFFAIISMMFAIEYKLDSQRAIDNYISYADSLKVYENSNGGAIKTGAMEGMINKSSKVSHSQKRLNLTEDLAYIFFFYDNFDRKDLMPEDLDNGSATIEDILK